MLKPCASDCGSGHENSAKIKPAKIKIGKSHCKSVGVVCMHAYCTKHTKLLSLSSEIHKVPVLHPFRVLCTLWIALPTSTHKLQSILANKRKRTNRPQCESAKINPARILILAKARKKDPRERKGLYSIESGGLSHDFNTRRLYKHPLTHMIRFINLTSFV